MPAEDYHNEEGPNRNDDSASGAPTFAEETENKIHVSRIPTSFDEKAVQCLLEEHVGKDSVKEVALIYKRSETEEGEKDDSNNDKKKSNSKKGEDPTATEHRGFGYVTFTTSESFQKAVDLGSVRGGRKAKSTKKHTLYLRAYALQEQESDRSACYLWAKFRCPYGEECKFSHEGEGGCLVKSDSKKKQKCFAFKKGKCKRGDDCPFSHDIQHDISEEDSLKKDKQDKSIEKKTDSEKDCINWKTKGKCRKGDKCPYKHDEALRQAVLLKKKRKQDTAAGGDDKNENERNSKRSKRSDRQPLWVRIFGLNYETTQKDVRDMFAHCGPIVEVQFPRWEDSGRSKGYCGVLFQSPKATAKALELDGHELMGRWLRVQSGKMLLDQWEEREKQHQNDDVGSTPQDPTAFVDY